MLCRIAVRRRLASAPAFQVSYFTVGLCLWHNVMKKYLTLHHSNQTRVRYTYEVLVRHIQKPPAAHICHVCAVHAALHRYRRSVARVLFRWQSVVGLPFRRGRNPCLHLPFRSVVHILQPYRLQPFCLHGPSLRQSDGLFAHTPAAQ